MKGKERHDQVSIRTLNEIAKKAGLKCTSRTRDRLKEYCELVRSEVLMTEEKQR